MSAVRLSDQQRLDWLRLIRSDRIGPRSFRALVNQFGGAGPALEALPDLARRSGRGALRITSPSEAARELAELERLGGRFVAQGEADYPRALLAIDSAPPLLAIRGSAAALSRPAVAVVGSRNASAAGGSFAERLAAEIGRAGFTIISGLARGIDTRAHRASLGTGTVAVLAGGHDRVYPDENGPLLERLLAEGGAAVSEMPIGWSPRGRDFPRRNRIVSGLALAVVVVEAARRSGSLITARFALEQGREVFAVPGSPLDPRAEGTNDLIRAGATLCGAAQHVLDVLEPLVRSPAQARPGLYREPEPGGFSADEEPLWDELDDVPAAPRTEVQPPPDSRVPDDRERVIAALSAMPISVDDLARQTGVPIRGVQLVLVELELARRLERHGGHAVSLIV
ncbi:DNA-processing protein DprA [Enterovirga sp.]|uniref:DNA-processing protein DprA n=1 Tax=Enterovirga sp. TaxID=2026350 RepID=UPI002607206B|nr:DNA-processing protein DprA [Enterovirga sp.]MDB5590980.1 protecting protein DprA [Enterovirga sp.]